jgi:chitodextrinase
MERSTLRQGPLMGSAVTLLGFSILMASGAGAAEVSASLPQDSTQQAKYDVVIRNTGSSALSGFSARIYFDTSELAAAGLNASHLRCDERYDPSGAATCTIAQYGGNVYYANLGFGSYSLPAAASVTLKVTLRLSDWSNNWNSSNDYSRAGLSSTATVTSRIPVYQGATRISGTDPGGSNPPQTVAAPTFTPPPGTYSSAQTVSIATSTSGASIRYTTGAASPTCSTGTVYAAPIVITTSTILRAIGCASGMTDSAVTVGTYSIKLDIPASAVSASAHDGNVPANTVDGNLGTRWSASGDGQWIQYDLGRAHAVSSVAIAWHSGDTRASIFEIQTSTDGSLFTTRFSGQSSGTTTALETYALAGVGARHVRILGHGNTLNAWNSIAETEIRGSADGGIDTEPPTAPTNLAASAVSSSQIDLAWSASTDNVGVTGYNVYRGTLLVGSPTSTAYSDTDLAASTLYSYQVRARDAAGNLSGPSNQDSAQTQPGSTSCAGALTTAAAIQNAMKNATAGAVIRIAPGTYTGDRTNSGDPQTAGDGKPTGVFYSGSNGGAANRIVLRGCDPSNPPVLRGNSDRDGSYGIHLTGDHWEIRDLIVQDAQKGIMLDNANRVLISNVVVHDVGDEAVHFRDGSSYNTIEHSRIYNTGGRVAGYGEGLYVGSDGGSSTYEHTVVDNVIRYVRFDGGITAEHIDVKEGATGTIIEYNNFNGTGISGANSADSFVDIKGVNTTVRHNTGRRNGNASVVDAFQVRTHGSCCATGTNNKFHDNSVHLDGVGTPNSTNGYVVFATSQTSGTTSSNDVRTDGNSTNIHNRNVNR